MSTFNDWRRSWRNLTHQDRMRWLAIGTGVTLGLYGLLIYPFAAKDLTRSSALLARRVDRIEKRAQVPEVDAGAAATLQGRHAKLLKEREALEERYRALAAQFAPANDPEAHQALLLELNTLAEASGIRLLQQGDEVDQHRRVRPLKDEESGRSFMRVIGAGDYWSLIAFLKGLNELSYASAPLGMELKLKGDPEPRGAMLDIRVDVTL